MASLSNSLRKLTAAVAFSALIVGGVDMHRCAASEAADSDAADSEAAEGGAAEHAVDYDKPPLEFQAPLFVFSLVLVMAFLFAAKQLAWKPMIHALDKRESRVLQAHAAVEHARAEVERLAREHEVRIAAAQEEVQEIVAAARRDAEAAKIEVVAAAERETQALQDQAVADILAAKNQALDQLSSTVDTQTALATEHVLGFRLNG